MFTRKIKALLELCFTVLFITGCSLLENGGSGSITFRIDGNIADRTALSARELTTDESEGLLIEISLKGGHEDSEIIQFKDGASTTFGGIPVGCRLYIEATAYRESDGEKFYTGKSAETTIHQGENRVELTMKKIKADEPVDPTEPEEPSEPEPTEYTITFVLDCGQWKEGYTAPASCTEGEKLAEPEEPAKASSETSSYFFEGWYTSADGGETLSDSAYDFETPVTQDLTLYAKWKEVPVTEISATISVEESSDISVTIEPDETNIDKGIIIYTFTADEGYESYTWKLDGEDVTATSSVQNTFTFNTRGAAAGTYDISLIAKKVVVEATEDTPAQYEYYSYEAHITVE